MVTLLLLQVTVVTGTLLDYGEYIVVTIAAAPFRPVFAGSRGT
jgi:hypothetical protein